MPIIVNAAPQFIPLGTDDKSIKQLTPQPIPIPQHLPKFYLWTEKGPVKDKSGLSVRSLVDGGKLISMYGDASVDPTSKYYTHATKFATSIIGQGNTIMVQRIIPDDNNTIANVTIYLDVLKDKVKKYKRHIDGSIAYDENGNPIEDDDSPIDGYRVRLFAVVDPNMDPNASLGYKTVTTGHMEDADGNKSTMYPIVEFKAMYQGEAYNNYGFAFELVDKDDVTYDLLESIKALPFKFSMYERKEGIPVVFKNLYGGTSEDFVFKAGVRNPTTNLSMELKDVVNDWFNVDNIELPMVYPVIEQPYVYYDNIDYLVGQMIETEKPYINTDINTVEGTVVNTSQWFDFLETDNDNEQKYLLNIFTAFSTKRVKYFSVQYDTSAITLNENETEVYFNKSMPIFMNGGTDGTLNDENFEKIISIEMDKYLDINSEVMDLAVNVESIFYDSGYSIDLKKKLVNFITVRKDTFLVLSTREDKLGNKFNDLVTERAIAVNLKARLQLAPESTFFGTPVARAMVVAGNGIDKNDTSGRRWPLTLHIAIKAARMMGAGDGKWKKEYIFDRGETNIIEDFIDIQPAFVPQGVKPALWSAGLVWPERYDLKRYYFPAMQTVYENDTSVLNSFFTAMSITYITKVAAESHRKFTGVTSWTPDRLVSEVESYMNSRLKDAFAGVVTVIPQAMITNFDKQAGYSWTTKVKIGANNMRTVNTFYIEAYRLEDL